MATETLRPNAAGDETTIPFQYPNSTYHWDKVDEVTADDATTYVWTDETMRRDLYNLPASSGQGPINKITVYARAVYSANGASGANAYIAMKTGGTAYEGPVISLTTSWVLYSKEWTTNPQSVAAWTWANIDALQIGVKLEGSYWEEGEESGTDCPWCTQVYVVIDYIPYSDIGLRIRTSTATIKIGTQTLEATHKLRIRKGATTYGIPLIAPGDAYDSGVRIYDGSAVKALPKVN